MAKKKKPTSRRSFLKNMGAAAAGAAVGGSLSGKALAANDGLTLDPQKISALNRDAGTRAQFGKSVDAVVADMLADAAFAGVLLENTDSVRLINAFNAQRRRLEPIVGRVDGRTKAGRYKKVVIAAELMKGASGIDSAGFTGGEEALVYAMQSSSSCSGCDVDSLAILGCCIVHFWGWTSGGSCTSCDGPGILNKG